MVNEEERSPSGHCELGHSNSLDMSPWQRPYSLYSSRVRSLGSNLGRDEAEGSRIKNTEASTDSGQTPPLHSYSFLSFFSVKGKVRAYNSNEIGFIKRHRSENDGLKIFINSRRDPSI